MVWRFMQKYEIDYLPQAEADIRKHIESGDKLIIKKLFDLINELKVHPKTGIGKPKRLQYMPGNHWARRITKKHRLVYEIFEDKVLVEIAQAWGHYSDK